MFSNKLKHDFGSILMTFDLLRLEVMALGSIWFQSPTQSKDFNIIFGLLKMMNHLHGLALPKFYIICSVFYKQLNYVRVPTFAN